MNLVECIKSAINQMLGNKMRTFLTMLGMFIGIGSVIMVLGVGAGVKNLMMDTFKDVGKGAVLIQANQSEPEYMINQEDLVAIREMREVKEAILYTDNWISTMKDYKDEDKTIVFVGVPYNMDVVQTLRIVEGRMYTEAEERAKANVCVVSETYARAIMGSSDPKSGIGQNVVIDIAGERHRFEVVGLSEQMTFPGMPQDMMPVIIYIPFMTFDQIVNFGDMRSNMGAFMTEEGYDPNEVAYQVGRLLDKRHNVKRGYTTQSATSMIGQLDTVLSIVTGFISFVAAISLLVGGIGIMNIMLVTVKERTREIGIRKAVGASNGEIMQQFLVEAIILTVIGGIIGMMLGYIGAAALGQAFNIAVTLTPGMISFAVGTSSVIGIVFGVYPARQASKLDPVEALRYE